MPFWGERAGGLLVCKQLVSDHSCMWCTCHVWLHVKGAASPILHAAADTMCSLSCPPTHTLTHTHTQMVPYARLSKANIPIQPNHCDCGLFVLTYLEYFVAGLPAALNTRAVRAAASKKHPLDGGWGKEGGLKGRVWRVEGGEVWRGGASGWGR